MRALLDTHVLLWWLIDSPLLGRSSRRIISSGTPLISPVSLWEISIKISIGKLTADMASIIDCITNEAFERLAITDTDILGISSLPFHHKDPFDRMLIAQAKRNDMALITHDQKIMLYDVKIVNAAE